MRFEQALMGPLYNSAHWQQMEQAMEKGKTPCAVLGLSEGMKSHLTAALYQKGYGPVLVITPSDEAAARICEDMEAFGGIRAMAFPARPATLYRAEAVSREMEIRRIGVLGAVLEQRVDVLCVTADALCQPLPPASAFQKAMFTLSVGMRIRVDALCLKLAEAGYAREERVEGAGQFAARGGIVDVFPVGADHPVRVEFFDDEVDALRSFDVMNQRSIEALEKAQILPAGECPIDSEAMEYGLKQLHKQVDEAVKRLKRNARSAQSRAHQDTMESVAMLTGSREEQPWERVASRMTQWEDKLALQGRFEGMDNLIPCFYPQTASLTDYFNPGCVVVDEPHRSRERVDNAIMEYQRSFEDAMASGSALPIQAELLRGFDAIMAASSSSHVFAFQTLPTGQLGILPLSVVRIEGRSMHTLRGQFDMLRGDLSRWKQAGCRVALLAGSLHRAQRLQATLVDFDIFAAVVEKDREIEPGEAVILPMSLFQGFEYSECPLVVIAERELFGASRSQKPVKRRRNTGNVLDIFTDLAVGDYVVHEVHGIGKFDGIVKLNADGVTRDYIKISYRGEDVLYVPTEQMDRVQKYIGSEGKEPTVHRLGGVEWRNAKGRVSKHIQDMADELLALYARRQAVKGHSFAQDTPWQHEMEDNFPYEETPDQLKAIEEIKEDMESGGVMDRLLCGDVGYGKTEVALRAAFKAVMDGKQVAFLAPTTVLAHQHYATMLKRFDGFGLNVDVISRFRSPHEVKQSLSRLFHGKTDIIAGTHRLLSKDVIFKDLGLLIVDEEQRFGVAQKEKIKQLKNSVDVLTLTATPIPRTLHMSMVGIRDISVLDTPPEERYPVQTMVLEYDEGLVRDAIYREVGRGGQVYFLYNRVESIEHMHRRLQALVPEVRIAVGHGKMPEHELEKVMMQFMDGEFDVLLCTTIIESGLDIPTANTLIVYESDRFGLSQLYQLRGRVGRSNRLAYAYFTYQREKVLSEVAEKRLEAIREFTEFGSGFRVAMRDLEIRGAGNLLGAQQSGHMATVGYGLYCKMIEDTVARMRGEVDEAAVDPVLDVKVDAYLPDGYVPDSSDRLELYRRIAQVRTPEEREDVVDELIDRFGEPPEPVIRLLDVAQLRSRCMHAGVDSVRQDGYTCFIRFVPAAPIDGIKLFNLLMGWEGKLTLTVKEPPTLRLILPRDGKKPVLELLLELLEQLGECRRQEN